MIKTIIFILSLTAIGCVPQRSAPSASFVQNVYGERIFWYSTPVVFTLDSKMPPEFKDATRETIKELNTQLGRDFFKISDIEKDVTILLKSKDGENTIGWATEVLPEVFKSSEQAKASVFWIGEEILETDIKINSKVYSLSLNTHDFGTIHYQTLLKHELLHTLGLKHSAVPSSITYSALPHQTEKSLIADKEIAEIKEVYSQPKKKNFVDYFL